MHLVAIERAAAHRSKNLHDVGESPGWDQLTGYGRLNARKALEADPNYYLYCEVQT